MYKTLLPLITLIFLSGCTENTPQKNLDAKLLIEQKCASCHNLNMPPIISNDELAPPMMAISFHVHNFMKPSDESQRTAKAINFVVDYVQNPSLEKSFCDKESLKRYGLMPSQKKNVSVEGSKAIATHMFNYYTQENLSKIQADIAIYNSYSDGKKLALKHKCLGCHKVDKKIIGPSLIDISQKFSDNQEDMIKSIKEGSKLQWESSNGAVMPAFKNISNAELEILTNWILEKK